MTNDYLRPTMQVGDWMQDVFLQRLDASGNKIGSAIQVNQFDGFNQRDPSIALLANGNVMVAWVSERPRTGRAVDNFAIDLYAREMTTAGESVMRAPRRVDSRAARSAQRRQRAGRR